MKILLIFMIFLKPSKQAIKCQKQVLQKFFLSGLDDSVFSQMTICPDVWEKCCSLADEIRIAKLWKERTKPLLDAHYDELLHLADEITEIFVKLSKLRPEDMETKILKTVKVPFKQDICFTTLQEETQSKRNDFVHFYDSALIESYNKYRNKLMTPAESTRVIQSKLKDALGVRHWDVELPREEFDQYRKYANKAMFHEDMSEITIQDINCIQKDSYFYHDFVFINERKWDQCFEQYEKMLLVDNESYRQKLKFIKSGLVSIARTRTAFYCSLCNAYEQKYFNIEKKQITFSLDFCQNFIKSNKKLMYFMHIQLIEYMQWILKFQDCFEGEVDGIREESVIQKYVRRIPLFKECFDALESSSFMSKCWFICQSYKVDRISPIFDGDVEMLKTVFLNLYSFVRKMQQSGSLGVKEPIKFGTFEGLLLEPMNPSLLISQKLKYEREPRIELLDNRWKPIILTREQIAFLKRHFTKYKDNSSLQSIKQIERLQVSNDFERLMKEEAVQKLVRMLLWEYFEEWGMTPPKRVDSEEEYMFGVARTLQQESSESEERLKVEDPIEIYHKVKNPLEVQNFRRVFEVEGLDLQKNIINIDFDQDITDIISNHFKPSEPLETEVMMRYLQISPKEVKEFNEFILEEIDNGSALVEKTAEFIAKELQYYEEQDEQKKSQYKFELDWMKAQKVAEMYQQEEMKELQKIKQRLKDEKIRKQHEDEINGVNDINHHRDKKDFQSNFNGIVDLFTSLLGD